MLPVSFAVLRLVPSASGFVRFALRRLSPVLPALLLALVASADLARAQQAPESARRVNACTPGSQPIGRAAYNFEDALNLVLPGSPRPVYPKVDVRAIVRYPAKAAGENTEPADGRFPFVLFLHGNHATCFIPSAAPENRCSCRHDCRPADRIPNHLGYEYMLDVLASHGIIAISVDGFDVTCASSPAMSDYEARGRLVLHHLGLWRTWDQRGGDPWGGRFRGRVDLDKIGLSGHSRGGEGVVAAEAINRFEQLGFKIAAVNAIAPTDQDPLIRWVPAAPYLVTIAAADGDVRGLHGLRTFDRTGRPMSVAPAEKVMSLTYGANHNFFNTVWTPGTGFRCAGDDAPPGWPNRLTPEQQRSVGCQTIVPFFRQHLQDDGLFRDIVSGAVRLAGLDEVKTFWAHQPRAGMFVDHFEHFGGPGRNSMGEVVGTGGAVAVFDRFSHRPMSPTGPAPVPRAYNGSFRGDSTGIVIGWDDSARYETVLPADARNLGSYKAISFRAAQILDNAQRNPAGAAKVLEVRLETSAGAKASYELTVQEGIPYPYVGNGGPTVLTTVRVPLTKFRLDNAPFPINDVAKISIELKGRGLIAIDDIQLVD